MRNANNNHFGQSEKPRVLFVASTQGDGGIERLSAQLAAALSGRGTPLLYACRPDGLIARLCGQRGVETVPWHVRNSGDFGAAGKLAAIIRQRRMEIVHVHSRRDYLPALAGVLLARRGGQHRPRLALHAHLVRPLGTPPPLSGRVFGRIADTIIAVSEIVRQKILSEHGLPPGFVQTIYNGVDAAAFALPGTSAWEAQRQQQREAWGLAPDALAVGMIGRLDAKGQDALLTAGPEIARRAPNVAFVLIGGGDEAHLRDIARAGGIADRVVFTGRRDDIPQVLTGLDSVAHLPTDEAFGGVLVEAMAAGLPTVATRAGGCPEIVRDGETGFLVSPGSPSELVAAFQRLLAPDSGPALRRTLGIAGRARTLAAFSLDSQLTQLEEVYTRLCPA